MEDHQPLLDPAYSVPAVPAADRGVAWLRAHVVRFSEGEAHARRRELVAAQLAAVDLDALRRSGTPVATLAHALGLPRTVAADVALVTRSYHPHTEITAAADAAVARLVAHCGGRWDEATANRIGLLVQAGAATDAAIAGADPPVPVTRRVAPDGTPVEVSLAGAPFGAGRHACPGRAHAAALVEGSFHRLHLGPEPLLLPNAWDVASAAAFVDAGFAAVGTTSLGVAAAHGLPDATGAARAETVALARRLVALPAPVTVDVESGFGDAPGVAAELADLGVAGLNLEDGRPEPGPPGLADPAEQAALVAATKRAAPQLFLNARVDTHWLGVERDSTLDRARRYVDAGADGIFVPGLSTDAEIAELVAALPVPLNLLAQRDVRALARLGVRRISTGSLPFRAALGAAVAAVCAVRDGEPAPPAPGYEQVQRLITGLGRP